MFSVLSFCSGSQMEYILVRMYSCATGWSSERREIKNEQKIAFERQRHVRGAGTYQSDVLAIAEGM